MNRSGITAWLIFALGFLSAIVTSCGGDEPVTPTPTPTITPSLTPTPTPTNPSCNEVMGCDDGFLWKPKSDNTGTVVVLFPKKFVQKFDSVTLTKKAGGTEELYFTGFANGDRQHWRGKLAGGKYTGEVVAKSGSAVCLWEVAKPSKRCD